MATEEKNFEDVDTDSTENSASCTPTSKHSTHKQSLEQVVVEEQKAVRELAQKKNLE